MKIKNTIVKWHMRMLHWEVYEAIGIICMLICTIVLFVLWLSAAIAISSFWFLLSPFWLAFLLAVLYTKNNLKYEIYHIDWYDDYEKQRKVIKELRKRLDQQVKLKYTKTI